MKKRNTGLNAVLADWDEGILPSGKPKYFSVAFVTLTGQYRYILRGKRTGLRFSMKGHDYKAVQPVDRNGNEIGHVIPVWIHSILNYRGNITFTL